MESSAAVDKSFVGYEICSARSGAKRAGRKKETGGRWAVFVYLSHKIVFLWVTLEPWVTARARYEQIWVAHRIPSNKYSKNQRAAGHVMGSAPHEATYLLRVGNAWEQLDSITSLLH